MKRRLLRSPWTSGVGLLALAVVGLGLIRGQLDLWQAGERSLVVLVAVVAADHLLLPLVYLLLRTGQRRS